MIIKLYNKFERFAHDIFSIRYSLNLSKHYKEMYRKNGIKITRLNEMQKRAVRECWGIKKGTYFDYSTHELYYSVTGEFDPKVVSEMLFRVKIDPMLNERKVNFAWDDKNYFDRFVPEVNFPYTFVRNIYGSFLDHNYNSISPEEAKLIISQNLPVIAKPTIASGLSKQITVLDKMENIEAVLDEFGDNFIVQRLVEPCDELKQFSPRSVNIMRIITAIIDGKPRFLSACLRANTEDSISDNRITADGKGMVVIGINSDGTLKNTGIYSCGEKIVKLPNGLEFGGIRIPSFDRAIETVLNAHTKMPMLRAIGWDVTIDKDYNPIVIEYNLKGMGIYYYQLANGPLFGDYTKDIVKLLKNSRN